MLGDIYYPGAKTIGAKMRDLILYHGTTWASAVRIKKDGIDLSFSKAATDFGQGFYLTDDKRTAIEWAESRGEKYNTDGALLIFKISYDIIQKLCFIDVTELQIPWRQEIVAHRIYHTQCPADIIIGLIADGGLIRLLTAYNRGYIDEGTLMKRIRPLNGKGKQYAFKTDKAIRYLKIISVEGVNNNVCIR